MMEVNCPNCDMFSLKHVLSASGSQHPAGLLFGFRQKRFPSCRSGRDPDEIIPFFEDEEITNTNPIHTNVNNKSPKFTSYKFLRLGIGTGKKKYPYLQKHICPFPYRSSFI